MKTFQLHASNALTGARPPVCPPDLRRIHMADACTATQQIIKACSYVLYMYVYIYMCVCVYETYVHKKNIHINQKYNRAQYNNNKELETKSP